MRVTEQAVIGILLLTPSLARAEFNDPLMAISEYQKQEWHVEDGLPQGNVRTIIQDSDRRLLIGSGEGITTFDGSAFSTFSLGDVNAPSNEPVNALLISRGGDLWVGTDDRGVLRRRGSQVAVISEEAGFHQERVRALFEDRRGSIWVATQNRVERITGNTLEAFDSLGLVPGDITEPFAQDAQGRIFIVTAKGLFVYASSRATAFIVPRKELGAVTAVYVDREGSLWIGRSRGVLKLIPVAGGEFSFKALPTVHGPVTSLLADRDGNLWVGTKEHGICRVSRDGVVTHWTAENGLPDGTIHTMFSDDEGNLWIGMLSGGLSRWRKSTLIPFGTPEGLPNSFAANVLADRRGDIWLGTWGSGLLRIHEGKLRQESPPGLQNSDPIRSLAEDSRGNVWIGTWFDGVYRYNGASFRHFVTGRESPSNAVSSIYFDSRGELWLGTYRGLLHFAVGVPEKDKGQLFLPEIIITSVKEDRDGSLVVGTFNGLYRLRDGALVPVTTADGLSNSFVLSVSRDSQGGIWVGTKSGGVDLIRGTKAVHIPPSAGVPAYSVFSVLDDGQGRLWMNTTRGLLRVPLQQLQEVVDGKRKTVDSVLLGKNDGMRSSECGGMSQPPATRTSGGVLWFATAKGFVHTNPTIETNELPVVKANISSFEVDREEAPASPKIALLPGLDEFVVHFGAVRLSNPWRVEYRYKLDGYDKDWTVTRARKASYRHLPPGQYRFLVSAHDVGQEWSDAIAQATVIQKPFLYQTTWSYLIAALSLAGFIATFFHWRLTRIKGRIRLVMDERNRIAREWHDTVMAGLAAISWQLEATRDRLGEEKSDAARSLDLARNMVHHSQAEARRIIWDLQDETAPVGTLSEVLTKMLDNISSTTNFDARLSVKGTETALSSATIHHLACICQEAASNAVRHGSPTLLRVELDYGPSRMTLSVRDDGCGFPANNGSVPGHFGLSVMKDRARKLGGELRIQSGRGLGTEVVVEVPVGAQS
jgi:ligand-binding sensor domain-containing protein/signal transduction histidine kinase